MLTRQTAACQIGDAVYYAGDARHYSDRIPVLLAGYAAWAVLRDEEVVGWLTPSRTAEATNGQAGTVGCYLAAAGGGPGDRGRACGHCGARQHHHRLTFRKDSPMSTRTLAGAILGPTSTSRRRARPTSSPTTRRRCRIPRPPAVTAGGRSGPSPIIRRARPPASCQKSTDALISLPRFWRPSRGPSSAGQVLPGGHARRLPGSRVAARARLLHHPRPGGTNGHPAVRVPA